MSMESGNNKEKKSPQKHRRRFLQTMRGIVMGTTAGAVLGSAYESNQDQEMEEQSGDLVSLSTRIAYHKKHFFLKEHVHSKLSQNIKHTVLSKDKTQYTLPHYVVHIFGDVQGFRSRFLHYTLRKKLALALPGLCAAESLYETEAVSPVGARYIWQMTKDYITDANKENNIRSSKGLRSYSKKFSLSDMKDFGKSTKVALMKFDQSYEELAPILDECMNTFRLTGIDNRSAFEALVLMNAHNTGVGRIEQTLRYFIDTFQSPYHLNNDYDYSAQKLFHLITIAAKGNVRGYGQQSASYVSRCLAGAEIINAQYSETLKRYDPSLFQEMLNIGKIPLDFIEEEVVDPAKHMAIGAAFGASATIGAGIGQDIYTRTYSDKSKHTDTKKPSNTTKNNNITRRQLIETGSVLAIGGIAANSIGKQIPRVDIDLTTPNMDFVNAWWNTLFNHEKEFTLPDGITVNTDKIIQILNKLYKSGGEIIGEARSREKIANNRRSLQTKMSHYKANYGRRHISSLGRAFAKKNKIQPFRNMSAIKKALQEDRLTKIEAINAYWRCRGLGYGNADTSKNKESYLVATPGTEKVLKDISIRFQKKVQEMGISDDWHVRLVVNGLVRHKAHNNKITGSSSVSPHLLGAAVDISEVKFDLIHKKSRTMTMLDARHGKLQHNSRRLIIVKALNNALMSTLLEIDNRKRKDVIVTWHKSLIHYHISIFK